MLYVERECFEGQTVAAYDDDGDGDGDGDGDDGDGDGNGDDDDGDGDYTIYNVSCLCL